MEADADAQRPWLCGKALAIDLREYVARGRHRVERRVGVGERGAEDRHEAVAEEFVDDPVMAVDRLDHESKGAVEEGNHLVRAARARVRGEISDIEEHYADILDLAAELGRLREQPLDTSGETCWPNRLVSRSRAAISS